MIHLHIVGRCIVKHKVCVNQVNNTIGLCIFKQKKYARVWRQILGYKFNFIDQN
jgi:hypothetical protein